MKKFTLSICFFFAFVVGAMAQDVAATEEVTKTSSDVTRLMVQTLGLNELDYIKLKALNQARLAKAVEVSTMYKDDVAMYNAQMKEIEKNFESSLNDILSPSKMEAYVDFKARPEGSFMSLVQEVTK